MSVILKLASIHVIQQNVQWQNFVSIEENLAISKSREFLDPTK
jgi:hypothetical protein